MPDDLDTFDPVRGPARELLDAQELSLPAERAAVILDRRRRQARFFDDRFLTARDLTRGQLYTLLRQADLAQLSGAGVVRGLGVSADAGGNRLKIEPGSGVARSGESVVVREAVELPVTKLRVVTRRPDSAGLIAETAATQAQTGLFVLSAFPVEHARNPGLAFPNGNLAFELADTEIVESTWFALVPVPNVDPKEVSGRGRARLAREVFLGGFDPGGLSDGLGLALVGISGGRVQWLDCAIIARDVGADAVVGFGLQRRKVRLAFQEQFATHLAEEVKRRRSAGLAEGLAAVEAFDALPPVGPLPRGAVDVTTTEVRQSFFPREIYVEMAIVPEDEVPALLAEGLVRAPIDLKMPPEALEGVPVMIVIPVARAGYDEKTPRLQGTYRGPKVAVTGRPLVRVRPIDALAVLRLKSEVPVEADPVPLDLEAWRKAVESASQLWYVRRQQFSTTSYVIPRTPIANGGDAFANLESPVARDRITGADEVARFRQLFNSAPTETIKEMNKLLSESLTGSTAETSVAVSGIMGELAFMARRPRLGDAAESPPPALGPAFARARRAPAKAPAEAPLPAPSPVFSAEASQGRLTLRPLQVSDVQRVATRFTAQGVGDFLRASTLRTPLVRSVLGTSAVAPELTVWATTPDGVNKGGVSYIVNQATAANVSELRSMATGIALLQPPPPIKRPPLEEARSLATIEKIGEADSLAALWGVAHLDFLTKLDETLATRNLGDQPIFSASVLLRLVALGYALPIQTDDEVNAIFKALDGVRRSGKPFVAPNRNKGETLTLAKSPERDAVLSTAAELAPKTVAAAQKRLVKAGFAAGDPTAAETVLAQRLLGLASITIDHIDRIANMDSGAFDSFVTGAIKAAKSRSITAMRDAVRTLSPARPPRRGK